ncbi:Neutral ceramidase [Nymphaea thermarum]|nr:Neutral ceramidase [Nymphaea thermarum]
MTNIRTDDGELLEASINRSPCAYLNNPPEERSMYKYDVDKDMTLLKFVDLEWGSVASFNWFATHGTSMSRTNSLISGDNKGAAARFMEDWFEQIDTLEMSKRMHSEYRNQPNSIPRRVSTMLPDQQKGELLEASINRSPCAYLNNPSEERSMYKYDVDKDMTLLKFVDLEWGSVASFNWFATHGTSMSRTNSLISGDNKGAAARFMEDWFEQIDTLEMSKRMHSEYRNQPNSISRRVSTMLPDQQEDTGLPCDFNHSTCNGKNELCYGGGPGRRLAAYWRELGRAARVEGSRPVTAGIRAQIQVNLGKRSGSRCRALRRLAAVEESAMASGYNLRSASGKEPAHPEEMSSGRQRETSPNRDQGNLEETVNRLVADVATHEEALGFAAETFEGFKEELKLMREQMAESVATSRSLSDLLKALQGEVAELRA